MKLFHVASFILTISSLISCGGGSSNSNTAVNSANSSTTASTGTSTSTSTGTNTSTNTSTGTSSNTEYDLNAMGIPRITTASYIDLSKITRISKFRSSVGHSYVDSTETCRSMKHYFSAPDNTTNIYSPIDGKISRLDQEWAGTQIRIQSQQLPAVTFVIFHVNLTSGAKIGDQLKAGQLIGQHIGNQTFSDIAVEVNTKDGMRLVSYIDTLNEQSFALLQARGIATRQQLIITKQERDAAALTCDGETFTGTDNLNAWVNL